MRSNFERFLNSAKEYPFLVALAAGLYPLLQYFNSNFTQLSSWTQWLFCLTLFIVIPAICCIALYNLMGLHPKLAKFKKHVLCMANLSLFTLLITFIIVGVKLKIMAVVFLFVCIVGFFLWKHLKKIMVLQLILALLVLFSFTQTLLAYLNYSDDWMTQPDNIENIVFKNNPNIYMIEMDGYVNSEELRKPPYSFDNTEMQSKLESWGFNNYKNFRSNYYSTLSSNASLFAMKHHYYFDPSTASKELPHSREIIVGDNPVLRILKSNGYQTNLIIESPYFLLNRPSLGFDYTNFEMEEVPLLSRGFDIHKDVAHDLFEAMKMSTTAPQFYFVQKFLPSHITTKSKSGSTIATERVNYLDRLTKANDWLGKLIPTIIGSDPNALIVILADHGGYVGLADTRESHSKQTEASIVRSMFSSILSIKWPDGMQNHEEQLVTSVNLFRVLFASLASDASYLNHLQNDGSYIKIDKGADFGVYQYLNSENDVVFKKIKAL